MEAIEYINALVHKHGEINIEGGLYYSDDSEGTRYYFTMLMVGEAELEMRDPDGEEVTGEDWIDYDLIPEMLHEFIRIAEDYDAEHQKTWERCNPDD